MRCKIWVDGSTDVREVCIAMETAEAVAMYFANSHYPDEAEDCHGVRIYVQEPGKAPECYEVHRVIDLWARKVQP